MSADLYTLTIPAGTSMQDLLRAMSDVVAERDQLRAKVATLELLQQEAIANEIDRDEELQDVRTDLAAAVARTSSLERTIATIQMRLRRAGQLLIEEIGADGPENADDTAERAAGVIRNQADAIATMSDQLGNLLAVIHRDGGHYESEHGTERACADAMQRICDTRAGLGAADELAMLVRRLARALQKAAPDSDLPKTAMDYLSISGLAGSPMRRDE